MTTTLKLHCDPPGPAFAISPECDMPTIHVTAQLDPPPAEPVQYDWSVSLGFTGTACTHSVGRATHHDPIHCTTTENTFTIPFKQVRGGDLKITVNVAAGSTAVSASTDGFQITGTNPTPDALRNSVPGDAAFRGLLHLESGLRQFRTTGCPLFSEDNKGGVGICQITTPTPTEDQVWSWKENLKAGWQFYLTKQALAKSYPARVRASAEFKALAKAFNEHRAAAGLPALNVVLPDFNHEQLQRDTLRAYNGFAGQLHEYRVRVGSDGLLVVTVDGATAAAEWEAITPADRIALYDRMGLAPNRRGDVNYVDDVMKQPGF